MDYILPIISGIAIATQLRTNSYLASKIGNSWASFFNYLTATSFVLIVFLIKPIYLTTGLSLVKTVPYYVYFGGIIGVMCLLAVNLVFQKITLVQGSILMFLGQTLCGFLLEILNGNLISNYKIIGSLIILLGVLLNTFSDFNFEKKRVFIQNSRGIE